MTGDRGVMKPFQNNSLPDASELRNSAISDLQAAGSHVRLGVEDRNYLLILLSSGLLLTLLVRTAWQADDAYAAWRLVDNFVHGNGLRYNLDERVQTFTSMLWTFLVAGFYAIFRDIYYTSVFLSLGLTLIAAALIVWPHRKHSLVIVFGYAAIFLSVSFMDFSCAGFENPLSHLILAVFATVYFSRSFDSRLTMRLLFGIAGLAGLTRLDTLAYYVLPIGLAVWTSPLTFREKSRDSLFFVVPLVAWHGFTLFYFGFPLQNAAYAKRFNNLPLSEYLRAGLDYYLNIIQRDPVTLSLILTGLFIGLRSHDGRLRCFAAGIGFYLLYILFIGGDYMSGRFFTLAYAAAIIVLLRSEVLEDLKVAICGLGIVIVLGCLAPQPVFLTDQHYGEKREDPNVTEWVQRGIANERYSWYQHSGLLLSSRHYDMPRPTPGWDFIAARERVIPDMALHKPTRVVNMIPTGYFGFFMPRDVHVYDTNGQVDPLMARLPYATHRKWVVGHLFKPEPQGYSHTLITGENKIADPSLAIYYEKLRLITRGELFSIRRLGTIIKMNLGYYDHYLIEYNQRTMAKSPPSSTSK
jgi:arabinofuranosyltransferase